MLRFNKILRIISLISIIIGEGIILFFGFIFFANQIKAQQTEAFFITQKQQISKFSTTEETILLNLNSLSNYLYLNLDENNNKNNFKKSRENQKPSQLIKVIATGYSSTPEETDETPFITAAGTIVKDGIIANNFYPFGTKVKFPKLFGEKIFVVEDRMNSRYSKERIDIWFSCSEKALEFGVKTTEMEIIE